MKKTAEEIAKLAEELSAQDRARLMSMIAFPSTRKGVIKSLEFMQVQRGGDNLVRIEFHEGAQVFLRMREFLRIVSSFGRPVVFEIDEAEATKVLVGKHVVIDEHATPQGVVAALYRDKDHHGEEPKPEPAKPGPWEKMGCDGGY